MDDEMIKKLEERMKNRHPDRSYNFFSPVGQIIEHVDTINFTMEKDGTFHFENIGQVNGVPQKPLPREKKATREMMSRAAKLTLDGGYWKAMRSWSVVYVVYDIWGYKGSVTDFVTEVQGWPDDVTSRMPCNRDAVEKLKNKYHFSKDIKEWRQDGVPEQYCILGEQLNEELEKLNTVSMAH